MLPEISLNLLDIAQNSIAARASHIEIRLKISTEEHLLSVMISDNGTGMSEEAVRSVTDPFYTTRSTRRVGLGIPFFKQAAECTGGSFSIRSGEGRGTCLEALFHTDHIDCMPLGDVSASIRVLVTMNPEIDFFYAYQVDDALFDLDTGAMREILGDVPMNAPEVADFLKEYLEENEAEVNLHARFAGITMNKSRWRESI